MRNGLFTDEQMVEIIREADREQVPAVAKRHGVSEKTIYTSASAATRRNDVQRLRQLEVENGG